MLESALEHVGHSQGIINSALQEAILRQVLKQEGFIPALVLFALIFPSLGLLGTVIGMIKAFKVITEIGTEYPEMLSCII